MKLRTLIVFTAFYLGSLGMLVLAEISRTAAALGLIGMFVLILVGYFRTKPTNPTKTDESV